MEEPPEIAPSHVPVTTGIASARPSPAPAPVPLAALPVLKHSGLGIASMSLSVCAGVLLIGVFVVAGVLNSRGYAENSPQVVMIGLVTIALLAAEAVAFGLGIGTLFQRNRQKLFGILGVVFSALAMLGTVGLVILGLMVRR